MQQLTTFQIIVLGVFAALTLIGVGVFAASGGFQRGEEVGRVVIWGTVDATTMNSLIDTLRPQDKTFQDVQYVEKNPAAYSSELVNAMAAGRGPDLFLLSLENLYAFEDKILTIPYQQISQARFVNSFLDEGQLYLTPEGILALPFLVDPLVMYWNRDLFANAGFSNPPSYWNDFLILAPKISALESSATVKKSAVALGIWSNITNAKEILATLFMQAGDNITVRSPEGRVSVVLGLGPEGSAGNPAASALRFYTEFANPGKTTYSWNRSLPRSSDMFASGDLAVYFGFASEHGSFAARNPNLRYAVAPMPQIEGASTRITYGRMTALAIPRTSANITGALAVARRLSDRPAVEALVGITGLPPVRRDVRVDTSKSASASVFVESSLIARGWLDPALAQTNQIFQRMIESVVSGQSEPAGAVFDASRALQNLITR